MIIAVDFFHIELIRRLPQKRPTTTTRYICIAWACDYNTVARRDQASSIIWYNAPSKHSPLVVRP